MSEEELEAFVQFMVAQKFESLYFRINRNARFFSKWIQWFICRLWFLHDIDELDLRCRNCGVSLVELHEHRQTPCLEAFLRTIEHRLRGGIWNNQ